MTGNGRTDLMEKIVMDKDERIGVIVGKQPSGFSVLFQGGNKPEKNIPYSRIYSWVGRANGHGIQDSDDEDKKPRSKSVVKSTPKKNGHATPTKRQSSGMLRNGPVSKRSKNDHKTKSNASRVATNAPKRTKKERVRRSSRISGKGLPIKSRATLKISKASKKPIRFGKKASIIKSVLKNIKLKANGSPSKKKGKNGVRERKPTLWLNIDGSTRATYDESAKNLKKIKRTPTKSNKNRAMLKAGKRSTEHDKDDASSNLESKEKEKLKKLVMPRKNEGGAVSDSDDDDEKKSDKAHLKPLSESVGVDWSNVGGLDDHIAKVRESVILPLLQPAVFEGSGLSRAKGLLFFGPPGTGKTLMARGLVRECQKFGLNMTFYARKSADLLSKYIGEGEKHLRELFETAKANQPSVIFFDEIDGLAPVRNTSTDHSHSSIVSTLLALMDGLEDRGKVIVIGATNRPDSLDPALRRPGRFDFELEFKAPDLHQRRHIFSIHAKDMTNDFHHWLAVKSPGFTGADIRAFCNEAALNCVRRVFPQLYKPSSSNIQIATPAPTQKMIPNESDFECALAKMSSSADRHTINPARELRPEIKALFEENLDTILQLLRTLCPQLFISNGTLMGPTAWKHPHVIVSGEGDFVTKFVGPAILHSLEHLPVFSLDLVNVVSNGMSPLNFVATTFREANRRAPSVVYLPNVDRWHQFADESLRLTLLQCLKGLSSSKPVCVICTLDSPFCDSFTEEIEETLENFEKLELRVCSMKARRTFLQRLFELRVTENIEKKIRKMCQDAMEAQREKEQVAMDKALAKQVKVPELDPSADEGMQSKIKKIITQLKASKRFANCQRHFELLKSYDSWDEFETAIQHISAHRLQDKPVISMLWEEVAKKVSVFSSQEDDNLELARFKRNIPLNPEWLVLPFISYAVCLADEKDAPKELASIRRIRQLWPEIHEHAQSLAAILKCPEKKAGKSRVAQRALHVVLENFGKCKINHTKFTTMIRTGKVDIDLLKNILKMKDTFPKILSKASEDIKEKLQIEDTPSEHTTGTCSESRSASSINSSSTKNGHMMEIQLPVNARLIITNAVNEVMEDLHKFKDDGDVLRPTFVGATMLEAALQTRQSKEAFESMSDMVLSLSQKTRSNDYNDLVADWASWSSQDSNSKMLCSIVKTLAANVIKVVQMKQADDIEMDTSRFLTSNVKNKRVSKSG